MLGIPMLEVDTRGSQGLAVNKLSQSQNLDLVRDPVSKRWRMMEEDIQYLPLASTGTHMGTHPHKHTCMHIHIPYTHIKNESIKKN